MLLSSLPSGSANEYGPPPPDKRNHLQIYASEENCDCHNFVELVNYNNCYAKI